MDFQFKHVYVPLSVLFLTLLCYVHTTQNDFLIKANCAQTCCVWYLHLMNRWLVISICPISERNNYITKTINVRTNYPCQCVKTLFYIKQINISHTLMRTFLHITRYAVEGITCFWNICNICKMGRSDLFIVQIPASFHFCKPAAHLQTSVLVDGP